MVFIYIINKEKFLNRLFMKNYLLLSFFCCLCILDCSQQVNTAFIKENYYKIERMIKMRDGKKLFTAIYIPKDSTQSYPFLIERTPYSCSPYGEQNYPGRIGPDPLLAKEKYIFVYQD